MTCGGGEVGGGGAWCGGCASCSVVCCCLLQVTERRGHRDSQRTHKKTLVVIGVYRRHVGPNCRCGPETAPESQQRRPTPHDSQNGRDLRSNCQTERQVAGASAGCRRDLGSPHGPRCVSNPRIHRAGRLCRPRNDGTPRRLTHTDQRASVQAPIDHSGRESTQGPMAKRKVRFVRD